MTAKVAPERLVVKPEIVKNILDKFGRDDRQTKSALSSLTFKKLYEKLDSEEIELIKNLLAIKPAALGFLGPFVSMEEPASKLVPVPEQSYVRSGQKKLIGNQLLPQPAFEAFIKMGNALQAETGRQLLVESGYRSPAHQALVFLTYLELFNFDIRYVASGVALPGYSQHGDPVHTAIDVLNQDGIPTDEQPQDFENTIEYNWLDGHAKDYGFFLSYPRDNPFGVKFEPWHWRYNP